MARRRESIFVGGVAWLVDWLEHARRSFPAPSLAGSKLLVATAPLVFWMPVVGMIVASMAVYRAYWLILPDWISWLLAADFFAAAGVTLVVLLLMSMVVCAAVV